MFNKKGPNLKCTQACSHCAPSMCTIENHLVRGIYKLARRHANVFIKVIVHAPS